MRLRPVTCLSRNPGTFRARGVNPHEIRNWIRDDRRCADVGRVLSRRSWSNDSLFVAGRNRPSSRSAALAWQQPQSRCGACLGASALRTRDSLCLQARRGCRLKTFSKQRASSTRSSSSGDVWQPAEKLLRWRPWSRRSPTLRKSHIKVASHPLGDAVRRAAAPKSRC